jgi:putative ABC transport system ATP-binding protein
MTQPLASTGSVDGGQTRGARVDVERVSRRFGDVEALREVTMHVLPGELVAVTGRSGSGKSTLLNLIGGLDRPSEGRVLIDGADVARGLGSERARRELIGFVFQQHLLLSELTAQLNVEVPLIGAGVGARERRARALELLEEVGLSHRAGHLPGTLSGGERQRVAVARALANDPRLLRAAEPTGALDRANSERIVELLAALRARRGMTVVIVSYDAMVYAHADRTMTILDGRLAGGEAAT